MNIRKQDFLLNTKNKKFEKRKNFYSILFTKFTGAIYMTSTQKSWFSGILKQELCEYKLPAYEKNKGRHCKLKNVQCRSEIYS